MATLSTHETVLQAGSIRARIAKVYSEALLAAALQSGDAGNVDRVGDELSGFVRDVWKANPEVAQALTSPAIGKKAKNAALQSALANHSSELFRGLIAALSHNGRLGLLPGIDATYRQILDARAGRVQVHVTTAVEPTEAQRSALTATLSQMLARQPVLNIKVDPELLGGMVMQIGDRVIDTSVRTRLETLSTQLLDKGSSYVTNV